MIKILCVGKLKEAYLQDLVNDYLKRISKYHKIEIVDLKGEVVTSEKLANKINEKLMTNGNITFIIGGSLGLNDEVRSKVNELISFSALTFPHGLFRGILLEQIYRSFKIINNETYHK